MQIENEFLSLDEKGILPITKSSFIHQLLFIDFEGYFRFRLPGNGDPYAGCGDYFTKGCLDIEAHSQSHLDRDVAGKAYIKRIMSTCLRASCPVCYEKWAAKEAHKIDYRLSQVKWLGRAVHVVVSVPRIDWGLVSSDYPKLRKKIYKIAKNVGIKGGTVIFHPFRQNKPSKRWYLSPHFHLICFGWVLGVGEEFEKSGYIIKNMGVRESVFATAFYQLSHCGIHPDYHTVTWFGSCSYNKLKVEPEPEKEEVCLICGKKLQTVCWVGEAENPLQGEPEGDYFMDLEGWNYERRYGYG